MNAKPNSNAGQNPSGKTPFQKFQALASALMNVPKHEIDAKERAYQKKKKANRKPRG